MTNTNHPTQPQTPQTPQTPPARDQEDLRKIHNEVTQIANQRFILLTTIVIIFGTLFGPVSKEFYSELTVDSIRAFLCTLGVYVAILWAINAYADDLLRRLRRYTIYLKLKGASTWEEDWYHFRRHHGSNYQDMRDHVWLLFVLIFFPHILLVFVYFQGPSQTYNLTPNKFLECLIFIFSCGLWYHIWDTTKLGHLKKMEQDIIGEWKSVVPKIQWNNAGRNNDQSNPANSPLVSPPPPPPIYIYLNILFFVGLFTLLFSFSDFVPIIRALVPNIGAFVGMLFIASAVCMWFRRKVRPCLTVAPAVPIQQNQVAANNTVAPAVPIQQNQVAANNTEAPS